MNGILHTGNRLKREALLYASVSLCVLITFYALSPRLGEFAEKHVSSPLSISNYWQNCDVVSLATTVRDNLRRVNYAKNDISSRTASIHGACIASQTYLQFEVNLYWNIARLCSLAGISMIGLHRACELLDMPPPSNTFSF